MVLALNTKTTRFRLVLSMLVVSEFSVGKCWTLTVSPLTRVPIYLEVSNNVCLDLFVIVSILELLVLQQGGTTNVCSWLKSQYETRVSGCLERDEKK